MTPKALLVGAVDPALAFLETHGVHSDDRARVLTMAIAGQESDWQARLQVGGPARSLWQFEKGGGVAAVLAATPLQIKAVCAELIIPFDAAHIFEAMAWNDFLAAAMARLNLWRDPAALPAVGDVQGGWVYYKRVWAPGLPHPDVWPAKYGTAQGLVANNPVVTASPTATIPTDQLLSAVGGKQL